jgi:Arc/MetJ-type ribon-helix-helix transcriptional regulator
MKKVARRREIEKAENLTLTLRIPKSDYEVLAGYVREGRYINVSEAVRTAVKLLIWFEGRAIDIASRVAKEAGGEERMGASEGPAVAEAEPAGG